MDEKKWHISGVDESFTREEFEESLRNWKPPLHYYLMWTWWDVKDFFGELSYYLRKLLRIIEGRILNRDGHSKIPFIDCDSWSLNYTVAELMVYGIKDIRKRGIGYPCRLNSIEEWHEILLGIQEGFEEYLKLDDYKFGSEEEKRAQEKVEKGLELFKEHFYDLWD